MPLTPNWSLPYPVAQDVPDVPYDMGKLADASDDALQTLDGRLDDIDQRLAALRFTLIRSGNVGGGVITGPTSQTINFGATFASPPIVMLSWWDGQYGLATYDNVTTTGATLKASPAAPASSTILRVHWLALGFKP